MKKCALLSTILIGVFLVLLPVWASEGYPTQMDVEPTVTTKPHIKPPDMAVAALTRGQALAQQQKLTAALKEFKQALALFPEYVDAYKWSAYCEAALGKREEAVLDLLHAVELAPQDKYAQRTLRILVYKPGFLKWVNDEFITKGPVSFEQFTVKLKPVEGSGVLSVPVAFTTSVVYPDETRVPLRESRTGALFNRVIYGYTFDTDTNRYQQRAALYYASQFLSPLGKDYSVRARQAMALFLLLYCYGVEYTGNDPASSTPVKIWLCEDGTAGGEQVGNEIYFYDMEKDRTDAEWFRELVHESGHLMLPPVDGFTAPEAWANGILGELLFPRWMVLNGERQRLVPAPTQPSPTPEAASAESKSKESSTQPASPELLQPSQLPKPRPVAFWWRKLDLPAQFQTRYVNLVKQFIQAGPLSPLANKGGGKEAFDYWLGMALYTEGALRSKLFSLASKHLIGYSTNYYLSAIADSIKRLPGNNFKVACGFSREAFQSDLTAVPLALSRGETCKLVPGATCSYYVYLTGEEWNLKVSAEVKGAVTLKVSLVPLKTGAGLQGKLGPLSGADAQAQVAFGKVPAGWYLLAVSAPESVPPVLLKDITFWKPHPLR